MARIAWMLALLAALGAGAQEIEPVLEVFSRPGCPHCERAEVFLSDLEQRRPVRIVRHDVTLDAGALARLVELAGVAGLQPGVPAFHARGALRVGFRDAETSGRELEALLFADAPAPPPDAIDVPLLGRLRADELGLPLFSVVLGLLDGFNPCAMWVLLFLLSRCSPGCGAAAACCGSAASSSR